MPQAASRGTAWRGRPALLLLPLLCWGLGLLLFIATLPDREPDDRERTDAIVVLTGGSLRLETGLALLAAGRAEQLFVSGVSPGTGIPDLLQSPESALLASQVIAGYEAKDTRGNALETAGWMRQQGYHSLRLVTSAYHMPRSLLEFHGALSGDTRIVPHPVFPEHVKAAEWFRWPGTALLLTGEYNKFLVAALRQGVAFILSARMAPEKGA